MAFVSALSGVNSVYVFNLLKCNETKTTLSELVTNGGQLYLNKFTESREVFIIYTVI